MSVVNNPFEDTLVYEHHLPVKWSAFDPDASHNELAQISHDNEIFLHVLLGLDEGSREAEESRHELAHELQRLDAKVNLLLQWVGQWLSAAQGLPESRALRLSERGIELDVPFTINVGETLLLQVYLNAQFPQPIKLPCEIFSVRHTQGGTHMVASFVGLTSEVHDLIEKFIFRHHRRLVALQRKQENPS
jgi:hypothetical protein